MSANQTDPQYKLRLPLELKEKIAESAKTHNRSMNADMVARLEKSFTEQPTIDLTGLQEEIRQLRTEAREMRMLYVEAVAAKGLNK
jgi:hypothetical protein